MAESRETDGCNSLALPRRDVEAVKIANEGAQLGSNDDDQIRDFCHYLNLAGKDASSDVVSELRKRNWQCPMTPSGNASGRS